MRSRVGIGAAALMGLCLTALSAAAQQGERPVTTAKNNGDTVKVTVSGNIDLDYVWRGREIAEFVFGSAGGVSTHPVNDFEGYAAVRINAELSDKVSGMVEVGSKRVDGGFINNFGARSSSGGGALGQLVAVREAQINVTDFLFQDLRAQFGITNWTFDLRGKGESMAFDLRHSQPITRNMAGAGIPLTTREGAGALATRAPVKDELEPVGLVLTYEREAIKLDLALLPAIIEGGFNNSDEALYAVDFMYKLDSAGMKGSRFGAIVGLHQFNSPAGPGGELMWTIGGGLDLMLMDKALELYGEAYGEFGTVSDPAVGSTIKAAGYAFQIGADYHLPNSGNNLWFGLNYTYYSGDKDTTATDTKMDRFVSYEGVHDLMILEDMYTGFDWDSNYWAFKLSGGFAMSLGSGKNNIEVSAIVGFARTAATVDYGAVIGTTKKLGDEVDLRARWLLNKQASIDFGLGLLFGSDIMKDSMLANAATTKDKTSSQMYTIGMNLKF